MLSKSNKINENYAAQVTIVKNLRQAPNADKLKMFTFQGNNILSSSIEEGQKVVYFPVECQIHDSILSPMNLYRHSEKNSNPEVKGFFEDTGRVKALKLRGNYSEGFVLPVSEVAEIFNISEDLFIVGESFDMINGKQITKKYIVYREPTTRESSGKRQKPIVRESKLVEGQFNLHRDTLKLGANMYHLLNNVDNVVTITKKLHGTSFVSSNVIIKKRLNFFNRIFKWLGLPLKDTEYGNLYSSRKVVKNEYFDDKKKYNHFYSEDIWGKANNKIKDELLKGETVYGEIVGFTSEGSYIQRGYDYGCADGTFDIYIYRITHTNIDGKVVELSYDQIAERAEQLGVKAVPLIWQGTAYDIVSNPELSNYVEHLDEESMEDAVMEYLKAKHVRDQDCNMCINKVPDEGICVTVGSLKMKTFKLKSSRFLQFESKELDKGEVNLEE